MACLFVILEYLLQICKLIQPSLYIRMILLLPEVDRRDDIAHDLAFKVLLHLLQHELFLCVQLELLLHHWDDFVSYLGDVQGHLVDGIETGFQRLYLHIFVDHARARYDDRLVQILLYLGRFLLDRILLLQGRVHMVIADFEELVSVIDVVDIFDSFVSVCDWHVQVEND